MSSTEIICGMNPVLEVLRAKRRHCHGIFITDGRKGSDVKRAEEEAARHGVSIKRISKEELFKLTATDKHQGIAARCDPYPYSTIEDIVHIAIKDDRKGFIVILDGITDPQNLGSIVRTANLMGVHGLIIPRDNAAPVNSTVVKASAGATEYLHMAQVTNLARTIVYIKEEGFWVSGADGASHDMLYSHDFKGYNTAIVLGSEGSGMRRLVKERCDHLLAIPMEGSIESYNVSIAGAIFMGEVARQRWLSLPAKSVPKTP